jgi:hypothetical protein
MMTATFERRIYLPVGAAGFRSGYLRIGEWIANWLNGRVPTKLMQL